MCVKGADAFPLGGRKVFKIAIIEPFQAPKHTFNTSSKGEVEVLGEDRRETVLEVNHS